MALKAVCVMKGDGATQGVINLCQEVCQMDSCGMAMSASQGVFRSQAACLAARFGLACRQASSKRVRRQQQHQQRVYGTTCLLKSLDHGSKPIANVLSSQLTLITARTL